MHVAPERPKGQWFESGLYCFVCLTGTFLHAISFHQSVFLYKWIMAKVSRLLANRFRVAFPSRGGGGSNS